MRDYEAFLAERMKVDHGDGIKETDVLNVAVARDSADERHICPLQLPVIERIVKLWSAPDDPDVALLLTPSIVSHRTISARPARTCATPRRVSTTRAYSPMNSHPQPDLDP